MGSDTTNEARGEVVRPPTRQAEVTAPSRLRALLASRVDRTAATYGKLESLTRTLEAEESASGDAWSARDTIEIEVLLREYDSLRAESLASLSTRANILLLGLAAIGAVYAGAMQIDSPEEDAALVVLLFSGAIPLVTAIVVVVWLEEAMRILRVRDYLAGHLEATINRKLGRLVLLWEASLKTRIMPRDKVLGPSTIVFGLLVVSGFVAPIVGLTLAQRQVSLSSFPPQWELWAPWALLSAICLWALLNRRRIISGTVVKGPFVETAEGEAKSSHGA